LLLEAIESILEGEDIPKELIVVDQSDVPQPTLATLVTDRPCEIRYVRPQNIGVSRARNAGAAVAQTEILAFTDDDVVVTHTWFGALIRGLLAAPPRTVITGRVLESTKETSGAFAPSISKNEIPKLYSGRINADVLYSGNMALCRSTVHEIGGFDEQLGPGTPFPAGEDNDLGYRILEAGYRIFYEPRAVLYHRAWRGQSDYRALLWRYGVGQGAFYAKHFSLRDRHMLRRLCRDILHTARLLPYEISRQPRRASGEIAFVVGLIVGAAHWLFAQRKLYCCGS